MNSGVSGSPVSGLPFLHRRGLCKVPDKIGEYGTAAQTVKGTLPLPGLLRREKRASFFFLTEDVFYQVRERISRNWATVVTWEFNPPSTVMIWPVT